MPIKYETILSIYDDKLTLLQYLKKVEKALQDDGADFDALVETLATKAELTSAVEGLQTDIRHAEDRADEALSEAKIYTDEKIAELPTGVKVYKHIITTSSLSANQKLHIYSLVATPATTYQKLIDLVKSSIIRGINTSNINPTIDFDEFSNISFSSGGISLTGFIISGTGTTLTRTGYAIANPGTTNIIDEVSEL